jgi:tRNA/tmRNA/rRNA uracil-C5-methylase (TrmA/RlmC/RlmD family)
MQPDNSVATINQALEQIQNDKCTEAREGKLKKPQRGATLLLRDANGSVETNHTQYADTVVKGLRFCFQAGNFFQNNPYILPKTVDLVVDDAATKPSTGGAI